MLHKHIHTFTHTSISSQNCFNFLIKYLNGFFNINKSRLDGMVLITDGKIFNLRLLSLILAVLITIQDLY